MSTDPTNRPADPTEPVEAAAELAHLHPDNLRLGATDVFAGDWAWTDGPDGSRIAVGFVGVLIDTWNGWAVFRCTREVAEAIVADQQQHRQQHRQSLQDQGMAEPDLDRAVDEAYTNLVFDGDTIVADQRAMYDDPQAIERITPDPDGRYVVMGWNWCWEAVDPAVCERIVGQLPPAGAHQEFVLLTHTPDMRMPHDRVRVVSLQQMDTPNGVAYTAQLAYDGEVVGTIHNNGNGGATEYHSLNSSPFNWRDLHAFVQQCRRRGEPVSEEQVLDALVDEFDLDHIVRHATAAGAGVVRLLDEHGYQVDMLTVRPAPTSWQQRDRLGRRLLAEHAHPHGVQWVIWSGRTWRYLVRVTDADQPTSRPPARQPPTSHRPADHRPGNPSDARRCRTPRPIAAWDAAPPRNPLVTRGRTPSNPDGHPWRAPQRGAQGLVRRSIVDTHLWFDLPAVVELAEHAACSTSLTGGEGSRRPCLLIDGPPNAAVRSNGRSTGSAPDPVRARYIDGRAEPPDHPLAAAICLPLTHTDPDDEWWAGPALLDQLRHAAAGACWFTVTIHTDATVAHATDHTREVAALPAEAAWVPGLVEAGPLGPYPAQVARGYHRPGGHVFARFRRDIAWWIALDLRGQPAGSRPAMVVRITGERVVLVHNPGSKPERVEPLTADPGGWWRIDGDAWPWTLANDDSGASPDQAPLWQTWGPDGEQRCTVCHAVDDIDGGELPSMVGYGLDTWSRCRRCGSTETSDPMFGLHTTPAPWPPPRQRQDELDAQTGTGDEPQS